MGISFEENITVARFYWLPVFNLRHRHFGLRFKRSEHDIVFPRPLCNGRVTHK